MSTDYTLPQKRALAMAEETPHGLMINRDTNVNTSVAMMDRGLIGKLEQRLADDKEGDEHYGSFLAEGEYYGHFLTKKGEEVREDLVRLAAEEGLTLQEYFAPRFACHCGSRGVWALGWTDEEGKAHTMPCCGSHLNTQMKKVAREAQGRMVKALLL